MPKMTALDRLEERRQQIEQQIELERHRLARRVDLSALPLLTVIRFTHRFTSHGTIYAYAAMKDQRGLWNTTGPHAPKAYSDDELADFIGTADVDVAVLAKDLRGEIYGGRSYSIASDPNKGALEDSETPKPPAPVYPFVIDSGDQDDRYETDPHTGWVIDTSGYTYSEDTY